MRPKGSVIDALELRRILEYSPQSGVFTWRIAPALSQPAGAIAGTNQPKGYICIQIQNRLYKAHRLAWLYMTSDWPHGHIDHSDLNKLNNSWRNLRDADDSQNAHNKLVAAKSKTGLKGVCQHSRNTWRAAISYHGRIIRLGSFPTPRAAHEAYVEKAQELYGEFARG
jgi:hypothetical protein